MHAILVGFPLFASISLATYQGMIPGARPITHANSIVAIYTSDGGGIIPSGEPPNLVVAVWDDGHVVWSDDRLRGGAPYRSGQIDRTRLAAILSGMERDGVFAEKKFSRANVGPDSKFTTIWLKSGKLQLQMRSWHELVEAGGGAVATTSGIEPLRGRRRFDVLRNQPSEYLYYRLAWSEIRGTLLEMIPSESKAVDGKVRMQAGVISWQESPGKSEQRKVPGKK
jgi:hypothetical protein